MKSFLNPSFFVLVFFASCVSLPRSFHALRYKGQKVTIDQNHFYHVGPLSQEWKQTDKNPGIIFKHQKTGAALATEAICGAAFEDLSLEILTNHLFKDLEAVQKVLEESWLLSGRKALYTKAKASLDGVPVLLNIVVIKKDRCQFDFFNVVPLQADQKITEDFLRFVKGFEY